MSGNTGEKEGGSRGNVEAMRYKAKIDAAERAKDRAYIAELEEKIENLEIAVAAYKIVANPPPTEREEDDGRNRGDEDSTCDRGNMGVRGDASDGDIPGLGLVAPLPAPAEAVIGWTRCGPPILPAPDDGEWHKARFRDGTVTNVLFPSPTPQGEIGELVERLRKSDYAKDMSLQREAATALERLSAERDRAQGLAGQSRREAMEYKARIEELEAEQSGLMISAGIHGKRIAELEKDLEGREEGCDSYADENQRFHDRIERLEGALSGLVRLLDAHEWGDGPDLRTARAALTKEQG